MALTNDDGTIVAVNRRLTQMFGYEQGELIGRPVEVLVPPDVRDAHRHYPGCLCAGGADHGERARLVGLRRDGATCR